MLYRAAATDAAAVVSALLNAGVPVEGAGLGSNRPLHAACANGAAGYGATIDSATCMHLRSSGLDAVAWHHGFCRMPRFFCHTRRL